MAIATGTALAIGAAASAGGAVASGVLGSKASKKAAEQQAQSTREALEQQRAMYEQTRGDLGPWRETGGQGLTALAGLLGVGGGPIGAGLETSPGYQFRLNEGLKALQRSAAARGTLLTGGTLKGLERFAQDYASGEYEKRVNQLAGLAGMGQNAAAQQGAANTAFGAGAADLATQRGNALAAGTVGGANAWSQAMGGAANAAQMYYLSRLFGQPGGYGQGGTGPVMTATPTTLDEVSAYYAPWSGQGGRGVAL